MELRLKHGRKRSCRFFRKCGHIRENMRARGRGGGLTEGGPDVGMAEEKGVYGHRQADARTEARADEALSVTGNGSSLRGTVHYVRERATESANVCVKAKLRTRDLVYKTVRHRTNSVIREGLLLEAERESSRLEASRRR
ncbi:hypothetical protein MTO96_034045 [Rhipicephalus appendiculatus]